MPENWPKCCICMENHIFFQNINEPVFDGVKCIEKLRVCVPKEQWEENFIICNDCTEKLDNAYSFVQLCLKSEEFRKEQLQHKATQLSEQRKHEAAKDFTCYNCNKSFRLKRTLGLHITRIHINPKKNVKRKSLSQKNGSLEDLGSEETKNASTVSFAHNIIDKDENKTENATEPKDEITKNDICDYEADGFNDSYSSEEEIAFKEKKTYTGKKRGPKSKGPQKCQYCELEFARTDRYMHHVRSKHTFEKPFKCDLCDAKYYSQHNLNVHARKHRNEKPFVCPACGKCFTSSNDLWQHSKTHNKVRQYGCDECDRSFKTHSNLRTHKLQMHQDPKMWKFVCTVCGKKFPLNNNLMKHMRRHEGIKDFMCHLCDKKFVEKIDLQTHLLSHSNKRQFKCTLCFKEYKKKETLRRHMKIEHDVGNFVVKKPEKKFNCPMCPKIFAFNNKLQRHILTHTGEKPVKCECCDKRFRDNYDRNSHLRQVHNVEPKNERMNI